MSRRTIARLAAVLLLLTAGTDAAVAAPVHSGPLTWQRAELTDPIAGFTSVSCVTRTLCRAGDRGDRLERWDGRHWQPGTVLKHAPGERFPVEAIDCPSTTFCAAVQEDQYTGYRPIARNPDGTWNVSAPLIHRTWVGTISCVDSTFCMLANSRTYQVWNGRAWSYPRPIAGTPVFRGEDVQCISRTLCRLVDSDGNYYVWRGSSWSLITRLGNDGGYLSCPTATFCMLVSRNTWRRFNGTTWSSVHRFASPVPLKSEVAISCVGPKFCVSVRSDGHAFTWDGARWHGPVALGTLTAQDVSCASKDFCVVTTVNGAAVHRVDGTWQAPRSKADQAVGGPTFVSCGNAHVCVLVDGSGGSSTLHGSTWTPPAFVVPDHGSFLDISCAGGSFCMTTEGNSYSQYRRNGVWTTRFNGSNGLVSCGTKSLCVTTEINGEDSGDYTTYAIVWNKGRPRRLDDYADNGSITASCAPDGCVLTYSYRDTPDGTTLVFQPGGHETILDGNGSVASLSCTSVSFCLGVTDDNVPVRFDGTSWTLLPGRIPKLSLSCASEDLCVSVGSHSEATWDGVSWGPTQQIVGPRGSVYDVSCKPGICAATGFGWTVIAR